MITRTSRFHPVSDIRARSTYHHFAQQSFFQGEGVGARGGNSYTPSVTPQRCAKNCIVPRVIEAIITFTLQITADYDNFRDPPPLRVHIAERSKTKWQTSVKKYLLFFNLKLTDFMIVWCNLKNIRVPLQKKHFQK